MTCVFSSLSSINKLLKMYVPLNKKYLFYKQSTLKFTNDNGCRRFTTTSKLNYQQFSMNNNNNNNRGIFKSSEMFMGKYYHRYLSRRIQNTTAINMLDDQSETKKCSTTFAQTSKCAAICNDIETSTTTKLKDKNSNDDNQQNDNSNIRKIKLVKLESQMCCEQTGNINDEENNILLGRPCSPHLTIFHWQLPGIMSGSHRMTGIMLSSYSIVFALGTIILPNNFEYYMTLFESYNINWYLLAAAKGLIALPFVYHYVNGIRHLIWDTGKLLTMKAVYTSGYIIFSIVAVISVWLGLL